MRPLLFYLPHLGVSHFEFDFACETVLLVKLGLGQRDGRDTPPRYVSPQGSRPGAGSPDLYLSSKVNFDAHLQGLRDST